MRVSRILPRWAPMAAITLGQRVFAKQTADDLVLQHEAVHVAQQKKDGARFYFRYVFAPRWRVQYEAEAYAVNFLAGCSLADLARSLSGPLYLWPCSFNRAAAAISVAASKVKAP